MEKLIDLFDIEELTECIREICEKYSESCDDKHQTDTQLYQSFSLVQQKLSDDDMWQVYEIVSEKLKQRREMGERFGKTRENLAEMLNISTAQVQKMQNIEKNAINPVIEAVKRGEVTIHTANEIARLYEEQQRELIEIFEISEIEPKDINNFKQKNLNVSV